MISKYENIVLFFSTNGISITKNATPNARNPAAPANNIRSSIPSMAWTTIVKTSRENASLILVI